MIKVWEVSMWNNPEKLFGPASIEWFATEADAVEIVSVEFDDTDALCDHLNAMQMEIEQESGS